MSMEQILATVRGLDGVLELAPTVGSTFPEISWGDHFFYFAPDGVVPRHQPYATIVSKDYPGDDLSDLDRSGRRRLNIHVGRAAVDELASTDGVVDFAATDVVLPHPVYARQGWVSIVEPGPRTSGLAVDLLHGAHESARRRAGHRSGGH
ncbi:DUF6194 family protein [Prescottella sp. R16]|uniref:DUF6194 family protein n=1 Tax=Prescottella sp. R16 TaxID=3064529 RepID=UPI00272E5A6D|nr:DUF6194 family protein [Prescottella sp. R16]